MQVRHVPVVEHGRPGLQPGPFSVAPLGRPLQASLDLLGVYELQAVQRIVPRRVDAPDSEVDTERFAHGVQVSQRRDVNPDRATRRFGGDFALRPPVQGPRPGETSKIKATIGKRVVAVLRSAGLGDGTICAFYNWRDWTVCSGGPPRGPRGADTRRLAESVEPDHCRARPEREKLTS